MTVDATTDSELMARVIQRDEDALSQLYDRYAGAAMGLAVRVTQDRRLAEEVVQEAFWRVWDKAASFDTERGAFRSWMFSITHRLAIDAIRRRKVRPQVGQETAVSDLLTIQPDPSSNVAEEVGHEELRADLQTALAELPPEQSEVIQLAFFAGLTRREIAERTGSPLGTVHTRARLALKRLARTLHTMGVTE